MNTPNLDKVRNEPYPNDLQIAIMFYGDEQTCTDEELQGAEKAAEIFAAMQARIEAAEKMAEQLRYLRDFQQEAETRGQSSITVEVDYIFNTEDAEALEAWEALKGDK